MPILDCPDHPSAAIGLDSGVLCWACGREVIDTPLGPGTREAPAVLLAEAKREYEGNLGVAAFAIEARATALGMVEEATDAPRA